VKKSSKGESKVVDEGDKEIKPEEPEEGPEDPPIVKQLKEIDDEYLKLEKEYERECYKLLLQYSEKQRPLLEKRKKLLLEAEEGAAPETGTPALSGFWLRAMQNHPAFDDVIQEWDEPVLTYLQDIERILMDAGDDEEDSDKSKCFKLVFRFGENPYFENTELEKEYNLKMVNPYCGEVEVESIKCSTIEWKRGKDVTVERVAKKVKGGGAKKAKAKKAGKEEWRPSFFRDFFRNLTHDTELAEDAREMAMGLAGEGDEDEDNMADEEMLACLMDNDYEIGTAVRDFIVPFAVRWFTGEASPDDDDDDEDDDEEDEEEEDDDDDDDDEDDEPRRGRSGRRHPPPPKKEGKKKANPDETEGDGGAKKEECKQQ